MEIRKIIHITLVLLSAISLNSCLSDNYNSDPTPTGDYTGFDFATVSEYEINIYLENRTQQAVEGVYTELYTQNPFDETGIMNETASENILFKGFSNEQGSIQTIINPASRFDSLYVVVKHAGFPLLTTVALDRETLDIFPGEAPPAEKTSSAQAPVLKSVGPPEQVNGYYIMGDWAYYTGYPYYLEDPDQVSNELLEDINASLPEGSKLPETHPQYLSNAAETNLVLVEDAEVWVTFVHEGAGYKNALGYYTYPTGNPPSTAEDINDLTIIFPNVSYYGSGGNLMTGDKVQLLYLDPEYEMFTSVFPEGTTVGWFLIANGFSNGTVTDGSYLHYSNSHLNIESTPEKQKHNVLLYDEERELMIIGFEDVDREARSDEDFNDAVFYTTVSPFTAVLKTLYQPIDTPEDTDEDGVSDTFDGFPEDPDRAFLNEYPGPGQFGTLVFEDLWPGKGDYDFNDLVIDYNFRQITNPQNQVFEIEATFVLRAIGASYRNGFGFSLNTSPENIAEITGQILTKDILNLNANGTEAGQSLATIMVFDDAFSVLKHPGGGTGVNTNPDQPFAQPVTISMKITFNDPVPFANMNSAPYNPFIFINGNRAKEVHLPMHPPTDLADMSLLGTVHDDSDPFQLKYYASDQYLPWALNIPVSFYYPKEKEDITKAYLNFTMWANSRGEQYPDWYMNNTGYRNNSLLYDPE